MAEDDLDRNTTAAKSGVEIDDDDGARTDVARMSRLPALTARQRQVLGKVNALEAHMERTARSIRRRIANRLDETPAHRSSHLRLFCTHHHHTPLKEQERWTLVVEGRLLVGHLDHASAAQDGGRTLTEGADRSTDRTSYRGISEREGDAPPEPILFTHFFNRAKITFQTIYRNCPDTSITTATTSSNSTTPSTPANHKAAAEAEVPWVMQQPQETDEPKKKPRSRRQKQQQQKAEAALRKKKRQQQQQLLDAHDHEADHRASLKLKQEDAPAFVASKPTVLEWTHPTNATTAPVAAPTVDGALDVNTNDAHAFHAQYDVTEPTDQPTAEKGCALKHHCVVATVELYRRRPGSEDHYKLSQDLASSLFPTITTVTAKPSKTTLSLSTTTTTSPKSEGRRTSSGSLTPISSSTPARGSSKKRNKRKSAASASTPRSRKRRRVPSPKLAQQMEDLEDSIMSSDEEQDDVTSMSESDTVVSVATTATPVPPNTSSSPKNSNNETVHPVPSMENDIVVPETLTMKELVMAIFLYVKERKLQDASDLHMIHNDAKLRALFGCDQMPFSDVQQLLVDRQLVTKVVPNGPHDDPIFLRYIMTADTATPLDPATAIAAGIIPDPTTSTAGSDAPVPMNDSSTITTTDMLPVTPTTTPTITTRTKRGEELPEPLEVDPNNVSQPAVLSVDVDVQVLGLYHDRTRELLRRVKRREFEYTSSRTKAMKMVTSSLSSSSMLESLVKETLLGHIVSGRGVSAPHVPLLLALAKTAPPGSEARHAAHADARMSLLLDRIQHHSRLAAACWDLVSTCSTTSKPK